VLDNNLFFKKLEVALVYEFISIFCAWFL